MPAINIIILILLATVTIILLGLAAVLQNSTLIEWWIPVAAGLVLALPAGMLLRRLMRRLTRMDSTIVNVLVGTALSYAVVTGSFYALNFYRSDATSTHDYSAPVLNKYSEEHYRTRRVSRNRVTRGETYRVYYVVVELPGGRTKAIDVTLAVYNRARTGGQLTLSVEKGFFGIPVIKNLSAPIRRYTPVR